MTTLAELIARHPEIAALRQNYPAIASALNAAKTIVNPDAGQTDTTTMPVPVTLKSLLSIVPPAEAAAIYSKLPGFVDDLRVAIDSQDREYLGSLLTIAVAGGAISAATADKLRPLLTATETVTNTAPATISGPSLAAAAGLGTVTASDVQAADVAGGKWS